MASAFSPAEREAIDRLLVKAARQCAVSPGIRKTTLEQLTQQAGISKSAFYKFYESKEHLFFKIMIDWHAQIFAAAEEALKACAHLPVKERVAKALVAAFDTMHKDGMVAAFSEDVPYLLRRLPQEFLEEKHSTYDAHISALLDLVQANFTVPREHVHAMLMVLTSSMLSRDRIGPLFQPALETLVEGMCRMVIE